MIAYAVHTVRPAYCIQSKTYLKMPAAHYTDCLGYVITDRLILVPVKCLLDFISERFFPFFGQVIGFSVALCV